ncbi:MAG: hypothetical protein FD145_394 [Candidatus Saganbacteria bacterium]|uniref:Tetratricopeptide repeat protein n=1 Tax=Candidatus Saganbacteria bacterium TaxID=2575572 RepID=A0A833NXF4_UNCSA|nr:MAG: hypothetical protein FD145_394 [Candidatus Saganbacteria bacterium]
MKYKKLFTIVAILLISISVAFADAKSDFLNGHKKLQEGVLPEALYYFQSALSDKSFILSDYVQFEIGQVYYKNGNYLLAAQEYRKVKADSNIYKNALYNFARCLEFARDYEGAAYAYKLYFASFEEESKAAEAGFRLACMYEKLENFKSAYSAYNQVDLYFPTTSFAKQSRQKARELASLYNLPVYKAKPDELFNKGVLSYKAGDYNAAEAIFFKLARVYPKSKYIGKAFLMIGKSEFSSGKVSEAISNLEKSLGYAEENDKGENLYYLGRSYGRRGKYIQAIRYMKKVLDYYPRSGFADDACYYLGQYYEFENSKQAALTAYLYLLEKYPNSSFIDDTIFKAGMLSYKAYDFDFAYKIFSLSKIKKVGDETPKCLLWWGKLAERIGKNDNAAGIYYFLADRFDHSYAGYRARERLRALGYAEPNSKKLPSANSLRVMRNSLPVAVEKYDILVELGLSEYAAIEGKEILDDENDKTPAQITMGKILQNAGEFRTPIKLTEAKVKSAIIGGVPDKLPLEMWQLAYPLGFWQKVFRYSKANNVDPYLTLAVIREESRFNPRALSSSRAHGLMQIIPSTGKLLAKEMGIEDYRRSKMYNSETNIMMGTYYLKSLIDRFKGNIALALAGYNGGPSRVKKWVNNWYSGDYAGLDVDEFIEYIPLRETKNYVQKVMGSYYEYKRIYGN